MEFNVVGLKTVHLVSLSRRRTQECGAHAGQNSGRGGHENNRNRDPEGESTTTICY